MKKLLVIIGCVICGLVYGSISLAASQPSEQVIQTTKDIQYSEICPSCKLDIYTNDSPKKAKPIMLFVHGGFWTMGSKSQHSRKANFFAGKDYVFVSVDYPLFPEAGYSTQAKSVAQSIRWIYDHADEYNADPNNIILMGHSSGGHLASLVSTDTSYLAAVSLSPKNIKHTILLDAGGLDIVGIKDTLPFLYRKVYKPIFGSDVRHLREASPVTYISSGKDIPSFLIFYSTLMVFTDTDAMNFAQKLSENHIPNEIYGIELSHERISKNIGKPNDEVTKTIMAYLPQP